MAGLSKTKRVIVFSFLLFVLPLPYLLLFYRSSKPIVFDRYSPDTFVSIVVYVIFLTFHGSLLFTRDERIVRGWERLRRGFVGLFSLNGLLMLGSTCVFCIIGEGTARLIIGGETNGYGTGPGTRIFAEEHVRLNAEGFRDSFPPVRKGENVFRVVGVGDSCTFGSGIKRIEDTYLKLLERRLNAGDAPIRFEVLNLGRPAMNTAEECELLERYGYRFEPDIVLLAFFLNDPEGEEARRIYKNYPLLPFRSWDRFLEAHSYFYYFSKSRFNRLLERLRVKKNYLDYLHSLYGPSAPDWDGFSESLGVLIRSSKVRGSSVVVVLLPVFFGLEEYPFRAEHQMVKEIAEGYGAVVLDLLPFFEGEDASLYQVNRYDVHPNEKAHSRIATAIFQFLLGEKLVPLSP